MRDLLLKYMLYKSCLAPGLRSFSSFYDDHKLNAYAEALGKLGDRIDEIAQQVVVIDLGDGAGILSVLAWRILPPSVRIIRIEELKPMIQVAKQLVKANGASESVMVCELDSDMVTSIGADSYLVAICDGLNWGSKAVEYRHEVGFLGFGGIMASIVECQTRLGRDFNEIIPRQIHVKALLAELPAQAYPISWPITQVLGFDLHRFSHEFGKPGKQEMIRLNNMEAKVLTEPVDLWNTRLPRKSAENDQSGRAIQMQLVSNGNANAIISWADLQVCEGCTITPKSQFVELLVGAYPLTDASGTISVTWDSQQMKPRIGEHGLYTPPKARLGAAIISRWHFSMLNDHVRNRAYENAICSALQELDPGNDIVLDIGAGSGLLGMIAARAGAKRVICCESVAPLAKCAKEIVKHNGLSDRVEVVHAHSTRLEHVNAALVVSEIVDVGLIGEHVLPTLFHAKQNLLRKEGKSIMIPNLAELFIILAFIPPQDFPLQYEQNEMNVRVRAREEFLIDMACLSSLRQNSPYEQVRVFDLESIEFLSSSLPVWNFLFGENYECERAKQVDLVPSKSGEANAVVMYWKMHLWNDIWLSTEPLPESTRNSWNQAVQFLPRRRICAKEKVRLDCIHSETRVQFKWSC